MNNRNTNQTVTPKVVFLVGAGISVPIGIPAMRGVYSGFLDKRKSGIADSVIRTCTFLTEELSIEPDLEELLLVANAISGFRNSTLNEFVERSVSTHAHGSKIDSYRRRLGEQTERVEEVRQRILEYLARTCFEFERDQANEILGDFVEAVAVKGCPVFSTNYDFALEHVASTKGIDVKNNFLRKGSGQGQRWVWDDAIDFPTGDALTLIKLHGSVTWYSDDTGLIEDIRFDTRKNVAGRDVNRLMIFPTRFKDIYDQNFFALYSHFLKALSDAEVLVVAGHSLRDEYLRAAIIERFRRRDLRVVVVDPTFPSVLPDEMKPARLGESGNVTHVNVPFEEFSDDLADFVVASGVESIPELCAEVVSFRRMKSSGLSIRGNVRKLVSGQRRSFRARIEVYLLPSQRPARLRTWLQADGGELAEEKSETFLETEDVVVGDSGGIVRDTVEFEVNVPEMPKLARFGRAILNVGLVRSSVGKPTEMKKEDIFSSSDRTLLYGLG